MSRERDSAAAVPDAPPAPRMRMAAGAAGSASRLLELQRACGNRAVSRLLRAAPRTLQRRRMPQPSALVEILSDSTPAGRVAAPDSAAHLAGLDRLWARVSDDLTTAQRGELMAQGLTGMSVAALSALPLADQAAKVAAGSAQIAVLKPWEAQERWAKALGTAKPELTLGDPLLIDSGPRPGTADAANTQKVVDAANAIFDEIAAGSRDKDVADVFGTANVALAKDKYKKARKRMNELHALGKIVTDRSGYNAEAGLGGLTNNAQISVGPGVIDMPTDKESIVIMFHESMHAGNPGDVGDKGYIDATDFKVMQPARKLTNAAHFEVVARRSLRTTHFQFAGETFVPAGTAPPGGGAATAALTPRQRAVSEASEMFRQAWTIALNLHKMYVRLVRTPADWSTLDLATEYSGTVAGVHFSDCLPFWSKVEGMTIHERTHINPAGGDPSTNPVTLIDIALSEGTIRRLARGRRQMTLTETEAEAFEKANATAAELAAATTVSAERDLLILLALRAQPGEAITGDFERDRKSVLMLGAQRNAWADMLRSRSPASFP